MPPTDGLRMLPSPSPDSTNLSAHQLPALEPPLTPAEREISKSYGGWTSFMQSMGLKAHKDEDIGEAKAIISGLARDISEREKGQRKLG